MGIVCASVNHILPFFHFFISFFILNLEFILFPMHLLIPVLSVTLMSIFNVVNMIPTSNFILNSYLKTLLTKIIFLVKKL